MPDSLPRWAGRVFLWLLPSFAAWHLAAGLLGALQGATATFGANAWFPGLVSAWEQAPPGLDFVTRLQATAAGRTGDLVFAVNPRIYSFGLALFAALCLATDPKAWRGMLVGMLALLPFLAWGVLFDLLQQVFIAQGQIAARRYVPTPLERNLIALGYQAGSILFPTAAPAVAWGIVHRRFLARWLPP